MEDNTLNEPASGEDGGSSGGRFSGRKQCLVICSHCPSPKAKQAGHKTAYFSIKELASAYDVDLLLILRSRERVPQSLCGDLGLRACFVEHVSNLQRGLAVLSHVWTIPPRYSTRLSRRAIAHASRLVKERDYSLIRFEFSQAAPFRLLLETGARTELAIPDVQIQYVLRTSWLQGMLFANQVYRYETLLFRTFDQIIVQSEKDVHLVRGLFDIERVIAKPPALSDFVNSVVRTPESIEPFSMLFWGAMDRIENEEAVQVFATKILPTIRKRIPEARLFVVGNSPSSNTRSLESDAVIVTGYVDDPTPYFARAALGVVPLIRGSGIKVKTLELLQAGLPVVTTPVGAEGVGKDGKQMVICSLADFANRILAFFAAENADNG